MARIPVGNLPEEVHRGLWVRIAMNGKGTKAEVRDILTNAVKPENGVCLGDALVAPSRELGMTQEDFEVFDKAKDPVPAKPLRFE